LQPQQPASPEKTQTVAPLALAAIWKTEQKQTIHNSNIIPANKSHRLSTQNKFKAIKSTYYL